MLTTDDLTANDGGHDVSISLGSKVLCRYTKQPDERLVLGFLDESVATPMREIAWYPCEAAIADRLVKILNQTTDSAP